jgi:hypothetical protein
MCDKDQPYTQDETILRQESHIRSTMAVTMHQLAYQLKMYDTLYAEHQDLLIKIKDRNLTVADEGPSVQ